MAETMLHCKNHPSVQTRVRCSSCGEPICPKCMRQSAVGMKCPDCAAVPRSALRMGRPRHYLVGAAAGFFASAAVQMVLIWSGLGLRGLLFPLLVGAISGAVVRKATGLGHTRMQAAAGLATALGWASALLLSGASVETLLHVRWLVGAGLAAAAAVLVVGR